MRRLFAERATKFFFVNGDCSTENTLLKKQVRVTVYQYSPVVTKFGQRNLTPDADLNVNILAEGGNDHEDCDFDRAIGGESTHRVGMKRKLLYSQDWYRIKRWRVLANVTDVVELSRDLHSAQLFLSIEHHRQKFFILPDQLLLS